MKKVFKIIFVIWVFLTFLGMLIGDEPLELEAIIFIAVFYSILGYFLWKKPSPEKLLKKAQAAEQRALKKAAEEELQVFADNFNKLLPFENLQAAEKIYANGLVDKDKFSEICVELCNAAMSENSANLSDLNMIINILELTSDNTKSAKLISNIEVLKCFLSGSMPSYDLNNVTFSFNKTEQLFYLADFAISMEKIRKERVGNFQGGSIRIAKGVKIGYGGSRGHIEEYKYEDPIGECKVAITNKNLYLCSRITDETFKISLDKITNISKDWCGRAVVNSTFSKANKIIFDNCPYWLLKAVITRAKGV